MDYFRTKSMADLRGEEGGLKRVLTATNLVLLGIGAIIGAGIFVLTGTAAAQYAGPASCSRSAWPGSAASSPASATPSSPR